MKVADGVDVRIAERTNYPFEETVAFRIEEMARPAQFPFTVRIPSWSESTEIRLNGEVVAFSVGEDRLATIGREWSAGDELELRFSPRVRLTMWKENARTVERGPLVYALKMETECRKVDNDGDPAYQGEWHYEHTSSTPWNYALIQCPEDKLEEHYTVSVDPVKAAAVRPWSEEAAPVTIRTRAVRVPSWKEYNQMAGPLPYSIMYGLGTAEEAGIELIPYGCTTLRVTEVPMTGQHSAE